MGQRERESAKRECVEISSPREKKRESIKAGLLFSPPFADRGQRDAATKAAAAAATATTEKEQKYEALFLSSLTLSFSLIF